MLPPGDHPVCAGRTAFLQSAILASLRRISSEVEAIALPLMRDERQGLAGRADIDIIIADIAKVRLAELPLGLHACGHRLGQRDGDVSLAAFKDLLGTEIASIGDHIEFVHAQGFFGLVCHRCQGCPITATLDDVVRDDQMVLRLDGCLHIVTDHARAAAAGRHGARIRIGQ